MCGIAGIVSLEGRPVFPEEVRQMCAVISHRGPDADGFYCDSDICMGMRRLSIIDLNTGRQPMHNEDGTVHVVFNGEIYNYRELTDELTGRGHRFQTASDTEVIVHLYEEYGLDCVDRMRGMFAFALWDSRRRQLMIARDRLGIKPLYYAEIGGRLAFGSELKTILELPEVAGRVNWRAASHLFTFLSTSPSESIIEGVQKLEPGHIAVAAPGRGLQVRRYWDLKFEPDYGRSEKQTVDRLRDLFEESVRLHMLSDVPVGAFLSGGVDSSAVVATMAGMTSSPVRTFSIGFPEHDGDDLRYARMVAQQFGTEHREQVVRSNALQIVEDLTWHLDEPFGDSSAIPTYLVSQLASQHVKVVLSGDGGDELFAGYDRYVIEAKERRARFLPWPVRVGMATVARMMPESVKGRNFLRHISCKDQERYLDACTLFRPEAKLKLFHGDIVNLLSDYDPWSAKVDSLRRSGHDWLSALQYLDLTNYLPLDILTKVDRMSMAHSIEARVPLLDHKLVEFAATIPMELRLRRGTTKYIFKQAMAGILPDPIINRPKQGFAIPLGNWFRGQLGGFVRELLLSERSVKRGIFNRACIERLLLRHDRGEELGLQLWTLTSFELWCRIFLDGRRAAVRDLPERRASSRPRVLDGLEALLQQT